MKVMIVDDEAIIREGLNYLLKDILKGYDVIGTAEHGAEALKLLKRELPQVLITDIRMPVMDGIQLCKEVRNSYPQLPIIIISGHEEFQYAKQALQLGVSDYLLKPVDRVELAVALEKLMPKEEGNQHIIARMQQYIVNNLNADLSLQALSEKFHLHPTYISQLYKKETNTNLNDYITEQRMQRAMQLLKGSNLKIYDIGKFVGYMSSTHFTTVFKQYTNCTPKEYRMKSS